MLRGCLYRKLQGWARAVWRGQATQPPGGWKGSATRVILELSALSSAAGSSMGAFVVLLSLLLAAPPDAAAGSPAAADKERLHEEVTRLVGELNSDRFEVRRRAAEQIELLLAKPELGRDLAAEFQRVLVRSDISFEVRRQVERWSRRLPSPPAEPVAEVSAQEIDRLLRQLDDDSYGARLGAARRVDWLLGNPKLICPIMVRLKRRLSDKSLDAEAKRRIETIWRQARGAWLMSDVADAELPAASDEQIGRWLDDLVRPEGSGAREAAECELLDLLARDDYVTRLKRAIEARLAEKPKAEAAAKLHSMLDWTKPELVAEYWQGRRQLGEQHVLVGVPTLSPGAARPTCFDRADERVAHCTSGNALVEGNYPVGEAFPHPRLEGAFFHLVSLPTPRRRMAYMSCGNADEQKRLAALSRRTLDRVLADKRVLTEVELLMLEQLDPTEVSRFAGRYFLAVDDSQTAQSGPHRLGGRPSRFGMICVRLAVDGSRDAMPGLAEAIAKDRFQPSTLLAPYRLEWLAALSIAARDPWPGVDGWLAGRVKQTEPLVESHAAAELGATAAAVLLRRHGQEPAAFGLLPVADPLLNHFHVNGYRFGGKEAGEKVRQWWRQERDGKRT
jgi:hypothetical protein